MICLLQFDVVVKYTIFLAFHSITLHHTKVTVAQAAFVRYLATIQLEELLEESFSGGIVYE